MDRKQHRASEAKRLLEEPLLLEAFENIEKKALEDAINADDDNKRREMIDKISTIRNLREELRTHISVGKILPKQPEPSEEIL